MSEFFVNLKSRKLFTTTNLMVLLPDTPPGSNDPKSYYERTQKMKVIWLLHGANGDHLDWYKATRLAYFMRGKNAIVVMPSGLNSDYANHPQFGTGYNFADFFFDELMPFVYNWLPASDKPEDNFMAGFSMGGAGTLMYTLMRPDLFGAVAPLGCAMREPKFLEPYRDMTGGRFRELAMADPTKFPTEFGDPKKGITLKEINMVTKFDTIGDYLDSPECTKLRFFEKAGKEKLPKIMFGCGTKDGAYQKLMELKPEIDALGDKVDVSYAFAEDYNHSMAYCDWVIPKMLEFFGL